MDIRLAHEAILNVDCPIPNPDCNFVLLIAGKRELVCRVQSARLIWLEDMGQVRNETGDGSSPESARNSLHCFVLEPPVRYSLRIGAWHDIDRFRTFLQRFNDLAHVALFVL